MANQPTDQAIAQRAACHVCGGDCAGANPPMLNCPLADYSSCCDTPAYCSSVRQCTAKYEARAAPAGAQGAVVVAHRLHQPNHSSEWINGDYAGDDSQWRRGWRIERAYAHPPAASEDAEILDWLETRSVEVRDPLLYGSHHMFYACPYDRDGDGETSTLRAKVRAAIDAARGGEGVG